MEFIEKHPEKSWDWMWVSYYITMDIIEKYPDKPWNWTWISGNSNITIEFIEKNIDKIIFKELSGEDFTYQNKLNNLNKSILALEKAKK